MASTITISKIEYQRLHRVAQKYELVRKVLSQDLFAAPATKNIKKIIKDFKARGRYNQKFLRSLSLGLKESDYFKRKSCPSRNGSRNIFERAT